MSTTFRNLKLAHNFSHSSIKQFPFISSPEKPIKIHNRQRSVAPLSTMNSPSRSTFSTPHNKPARTFFKSLQLYQSKTLETEEQQIVKRLNIWEQENLNFKRENYEMIYNSLKDLYKRTNNKEKLNELDTIEKIMKSTAVINQTFEKAPAAHGGALEKLLMEKKEEQRALLMNTIAKTNARFNFTLFNTQNNNLAVEINKAKEKEEGSNQVVYRKVINENGRKENAMRNDLMEMAQRINQKKEEKSIYLKQLNDLYIEKKKYDDDYNTKKNKLKTDVLNLQDHFDRSKKRLSHVKASKEEMFTNILKNASHGNSIEKKLLILRKERDSNNEVFEKRKNELSKKIKIINVEEDYLKYIYHSMVKEQRDYYYKILKNGYDVRYEGLVWVVRHLLEMNSVLEYHHFPKFLDHDQIKYLISLAQLFLNENLMTITLRCLKAKQQRIRAEEKTQQYNRLTDYCSKKKRKIKIYITNKKDSESTIKQRLLMTFSNLHNKYKEAFKFFDDKRIDDENLSKIINEIRTSLLTTGNYRNEEKENCLVKFFEENADNKDELEMILYLRDRIKEIKKEREKLKKDMMEEFKEREQNINRYKSAQQSLEYELRFSALFGCNFSS